MAFAAAALVGAVALALAGGHAAYAANAAVAMSNFAFVPDSVTVNVGDSVSWTNNDEGVPHSATSDDGSFDTGIYSSGTRSITFTQPGSFGYHCAVHPFMTGTVSVVGAATPAPTPAPAPPPTPAPTAPPPAPTVQATPLPPTEAPSTPTPTPVPSPTEAPTASPLPTSTAAPTPVAAQASPSPTLTPAAGTSRSGDRSGPLLVAGAVAGVAALGGLAFLLLRRP